MKILFLHYSFKQDGVTRSVLNNVEGMKNFSKEIDFIFGGDYFVPSLPEYIKKRYIDWNSADIITEIEKISRDADIIVIENPTVGTFPKATLAFKEFAEKNQDKKIIYRIHDFIDDRPHLFEEFRKIFDNFDDIYPLSDNVLFVTLTSFGKKRLSDKGLKNIKVLPNSIVVSDFSIEPKGNLRGLLEAKGIVKGEEKILSYPVRVLKRKNIEEALLLTKILNDNGEKYRLIVTIPFEEDYEREIEQLAREYNIPCSVGKASKYISFNKNNQFTVLDLYSISDLVISTSVNEGFGFAFVEPWLVGIPVIGRKLPTITEDFEDNGINLSHLYDNNILHNSEDPKERLEKVRRILSNPLEFANTLKNIDITTRINKAREVMENNREAIKRNYNHIKIAEQFLNYINSI